MDIKELIKKAKANGQKAFDENISKKILQSYQVPVIEEKIAGTVDEADIQAVLEFGELFDFRPASIITELKLTEPDGWCYRDTASIGHFGREMFPWERTDRAEALRDALGLRERSVA